MAKITNEVAKQLGKSFYIQCIYAQNKILIYFITTREMIPINGLILDYSTYEANEDIPGDLDNADDQIETTHLKRNPVKVKSSRFKSLADWINLNQKTDPELAITILPVGKYDDIITANYHLVDFIHKYQPILSSHVQNRRVTINSTTGFAKKKLAK